jgi:protein-disulfide isomerase
MMLRWVLHGIAAAGLVAAPVALAQDGDDSVGWQEAPGVVPVGKLDRIYGKPDARFSLIIWLDPECPYCKLLGAQPEHVVDTSSGRVNLAVRLYPLPFHGPNAVLAASTALCVAEQAGSSGFYHFLSAWMAKTGSNGRGIGAGDGRDDPVAAMAAASGARNLDKLAGCTASDKTAGRLAAEMKTGDLAGIEGTPAIAVRDNRQGHTIMVSGAIGEDEMRNAIRLLSHAADETSPTGVPAGATQ